MRTTSCFVLIGTLALILALFLYVDHAEAAPGRRGGSSGGGRKSGGIGGWFSSKKKTGSIGGGGWSKPASGGNYGKKKGGLGSKLKKAAVIGAVAYGGYQLGKLSAGYGNWGWGRSHGYGFNDWNQWREVDGFLCRENNDCNWIDRQLYCQDYELDFQPSALWFGGDAARIVGECACPYGMVFNDREMRCMLAPQRVGFSGTSLVMVILIPLLVISCCCCIGAFVVRKLFCQ